MEHSKYQLGFRINDRETFGALIAGAQDRVLREMNMRLAHAAATTRAEIEGRPYSPWPKPPNAAQKALTEARRRITNAWLALKGGYMDGE